MKVICVDLNYKSRLSELKVDKPQNPVIFMKPDSALLKNKKPFFIPNFSDKIEYEVQFIVRISRLGKNISEKFAYRYYDAVGVGIDFTAVDIQQNVKHKGLPWELCKAFDGSAVLGDFIPIEQIDDINNMNFHLNIGGETVQNGNTSEMIFSIDKIISYVSRFFTLKIGDIIFTGTPSGVGNINIGDKLEGFICGKKTLDCHIC